MKLRTLAVVVAAAGIIALAASPASAAHTVLGSQTVGLNGQQEVGDNGDRNGSGKATLSFDELPGDVYRICTELTTRNIEGAEAAHIHEAPRGENGPVVVTLDISTTDDADTCTTVAEATFFEIFEEPADYYVNVHNDQFPGGAIRGQMHDFED